MSPMRVESLSFGVGRGFIADVKPDDASAPPVEIPITVKHHITPPETAEDFAATSSSATGKIFPKVEIELTHHAEETEQSAEIQYSDLLIVNNGDGSDFLEGESGYGASASNDYHDDTSDLGSAALDTPVADDRTLEPETDDSEPGEPVEPDAADDAGAAPDPAGEDTFVFKEQAPTGQTGAEIAAGEDLLFAPEPNIDDPNIPTEPDPGDAEGAGLGNNLGGGDIILIDLM